MNEVGGRARGHKAAASGFSLIEMVIAIAVIAFTFIGLIGLMGLGVTNDQASSQQTAANNIAASILADLRSTPAYYTTATGTTSKSTRYGLSLPNTLAAATSSGSLSLSGTINTSATPLSGSGVTKSVLYFDNSPAYIPPPNQTSVPANAVYAATVYLTQMVYISGGSSPQSSDMARVVVTWPAQTPTGTAPAGSVEVISQFLIH